MEKTILNFHFAYLHPFLRKGVEILKCVVDCGRCRLGEGYSKEDLEKKPLKKQLPGIDFVRKQGSRTKVEPAGSEN